MFFVLTLCVFLPYVVSHTQLLKPLPRLPLRTAVTLSGDGPCGTSTPKPSGTYKRGQVIPLEWARNNHAGGFIRVSIVPRDQSKSQKAFNDPANIVKYACYESDCGGRDPSNKFSDDGTEEWKTRCHSKLTIPRNLPNGNYTLQWIAYGMGIYYGDVKSALPSWVSCHDFAIRDDSKVSTKGQCSASLGDVHKKDGRCLAYYNYIDKCHEVRIGQMSANCSNETPSRMKPRGYQKCLALGKEKTNKKKVKSKPKK